ncbi:MAG: TRAP transporter large permease subunit [Enterocloster bolteae]
MGFWYNFKEAIWALLVPIIILGGIYSGVFSPTEASVVACVYALFAGMFIYKDLKLTNLPGVFMRAAKSCSFIVIISFSTAFAKLLTLEGVTSSIANGVLDMTTNKYLILILINVLLLVVGMIMDAAPATIILQPYSAENCPAPGRGSDSAGCYHCNESVHWYDYAAGRNQFVRRM